MEKVTMVDLEKVLAEIGQIVKASIELPEVLTLSEAGRQLGIPSTIMAGKAKAKTLQFDVLKCRETKRVVAVLINEKWEKFKNERIRNIPEVPVLPKGKAL